MANTTGDTQLRPSPAAAATQFAAATMGLDKPKIDVAPPETSVSPTVNERPAALDFSTEKFDPTPTPVDDKGEVSSSPADVTESSTAPEATVASDGSLEVNHDYDTSKPAEATEDTDDKPEGPAVQDGDNTDKLRSYEDELPDDGETDEPVENKVDEPTEAKSVIEELYDSNPGYFSKLTAEEFMTEARKFKSLSDETDRAIMAEQAFLESFKNKKG